MKPKFKNILKIFKKERLYKCSVSGGSSRSFHETITTIHIENKIIYMNEHTPEDVRSMVYKECDKVIAYNNKIREKNKKWWRFLGDSQPIETYEIFFNYCRNNPLMDYGDVSRSN
jgi:hypothetical protein